MTTVTTEGRTLAIISSAARVAAGWGVGVGTGVSTGIGVGIGKGVEVGVGVEVARVAIPKLFAHRSIPLPTIPPKTPPTKKAIPTRERRQLLASLNKSRVVFLEVSLGRCNTFALASVFWRRLTAVLPYVLA